MNLKHILTYSSLICFGLVQLQAGNYSVDASKSEIGARVHASPPHNFTSKATQYNYDIEINSKTLEVLKANYDFRFDRLDSENEKRDKKMCNWMSIEQYPSARFEMLQAEPTAVKGEFIATGRFTMHGQSKTVQIPFSIKREGEMIILEGGTELNCMDWGLEKIRLFIFTVDPVIKPYFKLVGQLSNDQ